MSKDKIGVALSAYFRNLLNLRTNLDWSGCERIGKEFDQYLADSDWLELDNGTTFEKTFVPKKAK